MNALQIAVPPKLATPVAVAMFGPAIQAALRQHRATGVVPDFWNHNGALCLALGQATTTRVPLTERDIYQAVRTDLTLAHGARIDEMRCMGAAYPLLAVGFHATIIPGKVDPVGLVACGSLTRDSAETLDIFTGLVTTMLQDMTPPVLPSHLQHLVARFQEIGAWTREFPAPAAQLYRQACAANIELLINASGGSRPSSTDRLIDSFLGSLQI